MDLQPFLTRLDATRTRVSALHQAEPAGTPEPEAMWEELMVSLEELHVAEEELRAQQDDLAEAAVTIEAERKRYRELFELAPDGYLITDSYGMIREANRAAAQIFNVAQQRMVNKPISMFVPRPDRAAFRAQLAQMARLQRLNDWEIILRPRNEQPITASVTVAVSRADDRSVTGLRWLVRDISARKRVEAERARLLRRAEASEAALEQRVEQLAAQLHSAQSQADALRQRQRQSVAALSGELQQQLALQRASLQLALDRLQDQPEAPGIVMTIIEEALSSNDRLDRMAEAMLDTPQHHDIPGRHSASSRAA